jgi:unsaturated rhamnogalacturonyl hydrolase
VNDGLLGYAALTAYQTTEDSLYLNFAEDVADYLMHDAPRLADGTLTHDAGRVWIDTLLGSVTFLLEMYKIRGDTSYRQAAISQVLRHAHYLQDPDHGLYHHAWNALVPSDEVGRAYWGRGNGWALLADVAVLSAISTTHPAYPQVLAIMQHQAAGLVSLQDESGLWHTVVDRSDFYLESSASALIGYALRWGVQKGWLDARLYNPTADAALLGVWQRTTSDGVVTDVSGPTWPMLPEAYNARPKDGLRLYGQGIMLLLGSAHVPGPE